MDGPVCVEGKGKGLLGWLHYIKLIDTFTRGRVTHGGAGLEGACSLFAALLLVHALHSPVCCMLRALHAFLLQPILLVAGCLWIPAGRGYMDVNRISGYLPGKMVFFLMQASSAVGGGL